VRRHEEAARGETQEGRDGQGATVIEADASGVVFFFPIDLQALGSNGFLPNL